MQAARPVAPTAGEYVPAGHAVHSDDPAVEYVPAGHILLPEPLPLAAVLPYWSIEPGGHIYPAAQYPLHDDVL